MTNTKVLATAWIRGDSTLTISESDTPDGLYGPDVQIEISDPRGFHTKFWVSKSSISGLIEALLKVPV